MKKLIVLLPLIALPALAQTSIPNLPAASSANASDLYICEQVSGVTTVTRKCTGTLLGDYVVTRVDTEAELEAVLTDVTDVLTDSEVAQWAYYDFSPLGSETVVSHTNNGPAEMATDAGGGSLAQLRVANFDPDSKECIGVGPIRAPDKMDVTGNAEFYVYWYAQTPAANDVVWQLAQSARNTGESFDVTLTTHDLPASTGSASADTLIRASGQLAISTLTWAQGDLLILDICRDGADGLDTLSGDAALVTFSIRLPLQQG